MKKIVLLLMVVAGVLTAQAGDYTYLTFETTDGAKASVAVENLTLTVSGNTVTAGSQTFTLSNLSKMYFSTSDETTGIKTLTASEWNEVADIYDLKGRKVSKDQMRSGQVYVVKTKNDAHKIAVK